MKVLTLILASQSDSDFYTIENGINKTWNSSILEGVPTYYYFGNQRESHHDCSSIKVTCLESYHLMGKRTIEAFEYCLNHFDFDYIFRTNISSYVNKHNLFNWLRDKPRVNFASAVIGDYFGIKFLSGSGYSLSKDIVESLCKSKDDLDYNLVDDVCFGAHLGKLTALHPAPRVDCEHPSLLSDFDLSNFHFRCKTLNGDRALDSKTMNLIHERFITS